MEFEYSLLAKYLTGKVSAEELAVLLAWARSSEKNGRIWQEVVELRMKDAFDRNNTEAAIERALQSVEERIGQKRVWIPLRRALRYAAMVALVVGGALGYWMSRSNSEDYLSIMVAEGESVKRILLRDSSEVWLKGGATLRIPKAFSATNRSVSMEGEAFFSVKKDSLSPFLVEANDAYIKVLGTEFNVRTDEAGHTLETTLLSGHVVLQDKDQETILDMQPGEQVTYNTDKNEVNVRQVDVNVAGVWHLQQKQLEEADLGTIAEEISKTHGVHFNFADTQLLARKYHFVYAKEESIEDICSHLEFIAPVSCRIEGKEIFVTYRNK